MSESLVQRIIGCPELASLPKTARELLRLNEDPDDGVAGLVRIVSRDGMLMSRVLRSVNVAFGGAGRSAVRSVNHAITLAGVEGVKALTLGFVLCGELRKIPTRALDAGAFWRRSIHTASAALVLAEEFHSPLPEEAFAGALFANVGMLALDRVMGEEYAALVERAGSHSLLGRAEVEALGLDHGDVAAVLAERWRLAPVLAMPMANHHRPGAIAESSLADVARVVWLADRFAEAFVEAEPQWAPSEVVRTCAEEFGAKGLDARRLFRNVGERVRALAELFEISLEGCRDAEAALTLNATGGRDKRRSSRQGREGVIAIFPYADGAISSPVRATFRDASQHGLGVTLGCPLAAGARFAVKLPRKGGGVLPLLYRVVRCEQVGEMEYRIGAELESVVRAGGGGAPVEAVAGGDLVGASVG